MTTGGGGVLARTAPDQGAGDSPILIPPLQLRVEPVEFKHVSPFIREYHYLHRNPTIVHRAFAVWHGFRCVGALAFGQPAGGRGNHYGTWELQRFWLSDECAPNSESRVLAYCIRWIRQHHPEVHRLISYSDLSMGHEGIIYKATGWHEVGRIKPRLWNMPGRRRKEPKVIGNKIKWEYIIRRRDA